MTDTTKKVKTLKGEVVSDKMQDTIVVVVSRYTKDPKYGKFVKSKKRYKVHDAGNTKKVGDIVTIKETRPISKTKYFTLAE
jgi:small subunit ribosomal protein S17